MENIKSNELRLGNLVNHELFGVVQIFAIYKNSFDISRDGKSKEWFAGLGCKAIPLSEEWLLKFGFMNVKNTSNYWFKISKKGIEVNIFFEHIRAEKPFDFCTGDDLLIESVHQLQNHYFGETFEELDFS